MMRFSSLMKWDAELVFALYKTGNFMLDASIRSQLPTAVCRELHGPEAACHSPSYRSRYQDISDTASLYLTYYRIVLYVPAALLGLCWGAWSDQNGRKLPMIIPNVGGVLGAVCYLLMIHFTNQTLFLMILSTAIQGICCTSVILKMAVNAYVVDNVQRQCLTRRLSILTSMSFIGEFLASLLVGFLHEWTNIEVMLLVACAINACTVIIIVTIIKDRRVGEIEETESVFKIAVSSVCDSVIIVTIERPGNSRLLIILLFLATCLQSICFIGDIDIPVLYLQGNPLNWPVSWYGYYLATEQVFRVVGLIFIQPFLSVHMSDINLLLLSLILGLLRAVWAGCSVVSWMMWMSCCFSFLGGVTFTLIRSLLTNHLKSDETGKMFALLESIDIFTRPFGSAVYFNVYSKSSSYFPGMAYHVQALMYGLFFILMTYFKTKLQTPKMEES